MMDTPPISSPRLILRALRLSDFEAQHAFMSDPRVMQFIGAEGKPRPRQESWMKFCQGAGQWALLGYGYWAIALKAAPDEIIGMGGFGRFERGIAELEGFPEAGWAFAADHWGCGLASEFVAAITGWADQALNAPATRCIIDPANTASIRVAEKNGFVRLTEIENELGQSVLFQRERREGEGASTAGTI